MNVPPVEQFARVGGYRYMYAEAAERGYCEYLSTSQEILNFGEVEYDERLEDLKHNKMLAGLQTVVFAGMCFEAAIYDFAAVHLGDDYVRDHLDKLDVLSKWLVVLRFVAGVEVPKGQAPYGALKNLVRERNRLVHAKSKQWVFDAPEKQIEKMLNRDKEDESNVHNAFRALVMMSLYLDDVLEDYHNPLPAYDKRNAPMRRHFDELKGIIGECREVVVKRACN